jgi:hypothetical protein
MRDELGDDFHAATSEPGGARAGPGPGPLGTPSHGSGHDATWERGADDAERRGAADVGRLDDESDRRELRDRYYGLIQELRVVVTGVQVLLAFLLTVPFAQGFTELDATQRAWFGGALVSAMLSVIAFVTPTAMHRYGKRTARGDRLRASITATRVGLLFLACAMLQCFGVVVDHLYPGTAAVLLVAFVGVTLVAAWVVVPMLTYRTDRPPSEEPRRPR